MWDGYLPFSQPDQASDSVWRTCCARSAEPAWILMQGLCQNGGACLGAEILTWGKR
jgi:hypothetical protein